MHRCYAKVALCLHSFYCILSYSSSFCFCCCCCTKKAAMVTTTTTTNRSSQAHTHFTHKHKAKTCFADFASSLPFVVVVDWYVNKYLNESIFNICINRTLWYKYNELKFLNNDVISIAKNHLLFVHIYNKIAHKISVKKWNSTIEYRNEHTDLMEVIILWMRIEFAINSNYCCKTVNNSKSIEWIKEICVCVCVYTYNI